MMVVSDVYEVFCPVEQGAFGRPQDCRFVNANHFPTQLLIIRRAAMQATLALIQSHFRESSDDRATYAAFQGAASALV